MKVAAILGERKGGVVEVADPKAKDNWVVVKVHSAPMCTEYKAFIGGRESNSLGHEAAGEVVEVAQPGRVKVGNRVAVMPQNPCGVCPLCVSGYYIHCENSFDFSEFTGGSEGRATMGQYLLKADWLLPKIPDDISYDHGGMACCGIGPTFGACQRMGVETFDTFMVTGLGPVGLGGVINGKHRGARVIAVDTNPWRREKALELGADEVIDPTDEDALQQIRDLTNGAGVDAAVDCSGAVPAHRLCIDAVRRRGQVAFVGECGDETPLRISTDMIRKGITLVGSWHYNLKDVPRLMHVVRSNQDKLDKLITHTFSIDDVHKAWDLQTTGECAKVILKPWE